MVGDARAIGMFDSGVGGLTVARSVLDLLPREPLVYYGDTARAPYGPRPLDEIRAFSREIAAYLLHRDVKILVVACNSVEVAAIEDVTAEAGVPVVGVIDPGVRAAARVTRSGRIGVIGTEATIASGAYQRAADRHGIDARLVARACPSFVPFVERGDTTSEELLQAARGYLEPVRDAGVDTLILGCTHYPLLAGMIRMVMGPDVVLISSAEETARDVYAALVRDDRLREEPGPPRHEFLCSGDPDRFRELGRVFLGPEMDDVALASVQREPLG
ncbi:MAG TPA: glutamate racemase [Actinomycetota bacterium]